MNNIGIDGSSFCPPGMSYEPPEDIHAHCAECGEAIDIEVIPERDGAEGNIVKNNCTCLCDCTANDPEPHLKRECDAQELEYFSPGKYQYKKGE